MELFSRKIYIEYFYIKSVKPVAIGKCKFVTDSQNQLFFALKTHHTCWSSILSKRHKKSHWIQAWRLDPFSEGDHSGQSKLPWPWPCLPMASFFRKLRSFQLPLMLHSFLKYLSLTLSKYIYRPWENMAQKVLTAATF